MRDIGIITLRFEGITFEQTERLRKNIEIMLSHGVFGLRNGNAVVSFDNNGEIGQVKLDYVKYHRGKPAHDIVNIYKNAIIKKEQKIA